MPNKLRGMAADRWRRDPKLLGVMLARYKFVGKMFEGMNNVLEVGCNDGFGSRVVRQHVKRLTAIDKVEHVIFIASHGECDEWPIRFVVRDIMEAPYKNFDAVYCLDVFEHIADEETLLRNLRQCAPVCIIGTPSLESQGYATDGPDVHVNVKSASGLKAAMQRHWSQVFVIGMNDETIHVGHDGMRHYNFGIGVA